jgi:hypothetical protein
MKNKDNIINNDLKEVQQKLIKEEGSNYIQPKLPDGAKLSTKTLTPNLCLALVLIYKFYRHCEDADSHHKYFSRSDFFNAMGNRMSLSYLDDKEYDNIIRNYHRLKWWALIEPMPTDPDVIKYKKGFWKITETGIGFVQRELGMPKYALVYNDFAYKHIVNSKYVMIDKALENIDIDYNELMEN